MPYNTTIPATGHSGAQDYQGMQQNFSQIQTSFSVDHEPLASGGGIDGKHKKVSLQIEGSDPGSTSSEMVLYSKTSSGSSELFLQRDSVATAIQLTKGTVNITGNSATPPSKGHSFLPGGLLIQWGSLTATSGGTAFTFDVSFTSIFALVGGLQAAGAQASVFGSVSTSGAIAYNAVGGGSQTMNYIAIGT